MTWSNTIQKVNYITRTKIIHLTKRKYIERHKNNTIKQRGKAIRK